MAWKNEVLGNTAHADGDCERTRRCLDSSSHSLASSAVDRQK